MSGMKEIRISRRRFFEKSLYFSTFTFALSAKSQRIAAGNSKIRVYDRNVASGKELPDHEWISGHLKLKDPIIWLFTGDSITHGAKHTQGYRSYPEIFAERIRWELSRMRDIIINTGISGNTTQTILDDLEWRIKQFKPNVVSLMIGTNDCSKERIQIELFEKNLILLVNAIRDMKAVPILHTPNLIIFRKSPERTKLPDYVSVIRKVAEKEKLILIDNYYHWQDTFQNSATINVYKDWLNDPLHPNGNGHSQIARLMFKELSIYDVNSSVCGGEYYEGDH